MTIESISTCYVHGYIYEPSNSSLRIAIYEISLSYVGPCSVSPSYRAYYYFEFQNRTYTETCFNYPCFWGLYALLPYSDYLITVTPVIGNVRAATTSETIRTLPTGKFHILVK